MRPVIVEDAEVLLPEIGDDLALVIAHDDGHHNAVDVGLDGVSGRAVLRRCAGLSQCTGTTQSEGAGDGDAGQRFWARILL